MATLVIKSNAAQGTAVPLGDLGLLIPSGGSPVITLTEPEEIRKAARSFDLYALAIDDAFAGSSTIILNDGTSDIDDTPATIAAFLASLLLAEADDAFGVLKAGATAGQLDAQGAQIKNIAAATDDNDVPTWLQVQTLIDGVVWKDPVRATADSNVALTGTQTIDGVSLAAEERVVLRGQTTGSENGIWLVQAGAWTRPADFANGAVAAGATMWVNEGTTYGDTRWTCTNDAGSDVVDTDALTFVDTTGGATSIIAGDGVSFTGNTLNVGAGNGIQVNADTVEVIYGAVTGIGSANANGVANSAARSDHVHAHGDRGGDGTVSQHDADQVDLEATLQELPSAPGTVEAAFGDVNSALQAGKYVGKVYGFGQTSKVKDGSPLYLLGPGGVSTLDAPIVMPRAGRITATAVKLDAAVGGGKAYDYEVLVNGVVAASATLAVAAAATKAKNNALDVDFAEDDEISIRANLNTGAGDSAFRSQAYTLEVAFVQVP